MPTFGHICANGWNFSQTCFTVVWLPVILLVLSYWCMSSLSLNTSNAPSLTSCDIVTGILICTNQGRCLFRTDFYPEAAIQAGYLQTSNRLEIVGWL